MSQQWKRTEREICRRLGGRRAGPIGAAVSDCVNVPWAVEVKRSQRDCVLASWITQARTQGKLERREFVLVTVQPGQNLDDAATTIRFAHFETLAADADWIPALPAEIATMEDCLP